MIKMTLIGNVGKDAELKEISGNLYACFDLAHTEKIRGEKKTTWYRVRKLDKDGTLTQYINKGKSMYAEGRPIATAYQNHEGKLVADLTLWADRIEFVAGSQQPTANLGSGQGNMVQAEQNPAYYAQMPISSQYQAQPQVQMSSAQRYVQPTSQPITAPIEQPIQEPKSAATPIWEQPLPFQKTLNEPRKHLRALRPGEVIERGEPQRFHKPEPAAVDSQPAMQPISIKDLPF